MHIRGIIKKYIGKIVVLSSIIMISTVLNIIAPLVLEKVIEDKEELFNGLFLYFFIFACSSGCNLCYTWLKKKYSVKFKVNESLRLSKLIYSMDYSKIIKKEPTYLMERLEEAVANLFNLISEGISEIVTGILTIIILIFIMKKYSLVLMSLYIVYTVFSLIGFRYLNKILLEKSIKLQDVVANNFKSILAFMTNVDFMKLLTKFDYIGKHLKKYYKSSAQENAEVNFFAEVVCTVLMFLLNIVQNCIYVYVFYLSFINKISFTEVAVIILLNNIYKNSMDIVINMNINLRDVRASIDFINKIILANQELEQGNKRIENISSVKLICKNIAHDKTVLIKEGIFEAHSGEVIGLIGESGIGKSTLIKIMIGLLASSESKILYNNIDIKDIDKSSLRKHMMYISQNPSVFPITFKENFLLEIDDEDYNFASKQLVNILKFQGFEKFNSLESGLDTIVLEGGANLSGGDRQKIAIVRILLSSPDLLILDEFSNSIDKKTEEFVIETIKKKYKNKIVVLITHNHNLLEACNEIYKIEEKCLIKIKQGGEFNERSRENIC
jgi:ABC-type bacteriocin/lantibiotic exporter with double-glycine peptidase domain